MVKRYGLIALMMTSIVYMASAQSIEQNDSVESKTINLDEVVVKAALVKHDPRFDEYRITPELSKGAASVYDVISRLPGVAYNDLKNTISVRMDYNVIIEVDGKQVSPEYVRALSIDRISKIRIVYVPSARYSTEGVHYVINIKLKNDFIGHDLYVGNYTMISSGDNNGSNVVANEQPRTQYIYSGDKIDITAGYGFAAIHWNYPIGYIRDYDGIASIKSEEVGVKNPNDCNSTISNAANLGIDWQIAPYQTLSLRGSFQRDNVKHHSAYDVTENETSQLSVKKYPELSEESSKVNDMAAAIYYQGTFGSGWSVYSALGYNKIRDNINSEYSGFDFNNTSGYRNTKDYFRGELDLDYSFNDAISLNFGYRGVWNRYMTHSWERGLILSKDEDGRHNAFVFLDWSPRDNILFHLGTGVEALHKKGLDSKRDWLEFLQQAMVTIQPSDKVQLMAEYTTKMEYPSLFQVSDNPIAIDRWLMQSGNPHLSPSRRQTVSFQASLFESLIIGTEYTHVHNSITDWYEKNEGNTFLKTFTNAGTQNFRAVIAYNWSIIKDLSWNNIIQWQWQKVTGHGLSSHTSNLSWNSNMEYWINPIGLLAKVEYTREMQKNPLLQGWQQYGQDLWQISLRKSFIDDALAVSLNYVPPIHLGIRTSQESSIETSFFKQRQNLNLHTYDNLLMLRIEWRFNKGRKKQRRIQEYEFDIEQKIDKGLL